MGMGLFGGDFVWVGDDWEGDGDGEVGGRTSCRAGSALKEMDVSPKRYDRTESDEYIFAGRR